MVPMGYMSYIVVNITQWRAYKILLVIIDYQMLRLIINRNSKKQIVKARFPVMPEHNFTQFTNNCV